MELVRTLPEERTVTMIVRRLGRFLSVLIALILPLLPVPSAARAQAALQITITGLAADTLLVSQAEHLAVEAVVRDAAGNNAHAEIARVTFRVLAADGTARYTHHERRPAYCAFGGDTTCAAISANSFAALPDGQYQLEVVAQTRSGRTARTARSFVIDRSFRITLVAPSAGARITSADQTVFEATVRSHDRTTSTRITHVTFDLLDAAGALRFQRIEHHPRYCAGGGDAHCRPLDTQMLASLPSGDYTLRVQARRSDGAVSAPVTTRFVLDLSSTPPPDPTDTTTPSPAASPVPPTPDPTGPQVTVVVPQPGASYGNAADLAFEAQAYDPAVGATNGAGIRQVEFDLIGTGIRATERHPRYCAFGGDTACAAMPATRFDRLADGNYTLRVRAIGSDGTVGTWVSRRFRIDRGSTPSPLPSPSVPPEPVNRTAHTGAVLDISLQAARDYDPVEAYTQVAVTAVFTQGERTVRVAGFWDGERTWRVRWTPPADGTWRYRITANTADPGLQQQGRIRVTTGTTRGFLRVDPTTERFVFADGTYPYLVGTTAYELVQQVRVGGTSWRDAFAGYAAHGIRKLRLLAYPFPVNPDRPNPYPDSAPFVGDDHDRLDLNHWRALDEIVQTAHAQDLIIDLILFQNRRRAFGTETQDTRYLRYALARYAAYPNLVWTVTNEWEATPKDESYWNRMGTILRAEDPWMVAADGRMRPLSIHQISDPTFDYVGSGWPTHAIIQYNHRAGLPYGDQWGAASITPNRGHGLPVINDEIGYLGESRNGITVDRAQQRRALWAIAASGGYTSIGDASLVNGGLIYKSGDWFDLGPVYDDVRRLVTTVEALPQWWNWTPQPQLIADGTRVYAIGHPQHGYLVYAAGGGRVQLRLPDGRYELTRLDPTNGNRQALTPVAGDTVTWTAPTTQDWVLFITPN
jgi:hypothetical protein